MAADQDVVADLHAGAEQQSGGEIGGLKRRPAHRVDVLESLDLPMIRGMLAVTVGRKLRVVEPVVCA